MTTRIKAHSTISWAACGKYTDIQYHKAGGIAKITISRPEVRNAFRPQTVKEMSRALNDARDDEQIGVIILTGEGKEAFCSGGDQTIRGDAGYKDEKGIHRLNVLDFQRQMRTCPKPIIAMVAGYAIPWLRESWSGGRVVKQPMMLTHRKESFGASGGRSTK